MTRAPHVPAELTVGPFTLEQARRAGLERWHLEGPAWKRLGPGVHACAGLEEKPEILLAAARLRMPPDALFSGSTAGWLHGLGTSPCNPIEVSVPAGSPSSQLTGMKLRRVALSKGDVVTLRGIPATSVERTIADLCANLTVTEAVVLPDTATHKRLTTLNRLQATCTCSVGRPGAETLRRLLPFLEPATESPMETRMRMVIVLSRLPPPVVQQSLYDRFGRFLGRPDLYYPQAKLGIEYDGEVHESSVAADNRRQNRLLAAGIRLLRFTAGDIYNTPEKLVEQVRGMLAA